MSATTVIEGAGVMTTTTTSDLLVNFVSTGSECWIVTSIGESKVAIAGQGNVNVVTTANGKTVEGTMRGVLLVPDLWINLYFI